MFSPSAATLGVVEDMKTVMRNPKAVTPRNRSRLAFLAPPSPVYSVITLGHDFDETDPLEFRQMDKQQGYTSL